MGYTTEFTGSVRVEPPLNEHESGYLDDFAATRHMVRGRGPYYVNGSLGRGDESDVTDHNEPPPGQPGLWCQWEPTFDGSHIEWNNMEKFYHAAEWMQYLIDHFLKPGAEASKDACPCCGRSSDPIFNEFTFDHVVNGEIQAQGEDPDDRWLLIVKDNVVTTKKGRVVYE